MQRRSLKRYLASAAAVAVAAGLTLSVHAQNNYQAVVDAAYAK